MVLEIVINNKIRKKHYLKSDDDFYVNQILSSYCQEAIPVLREKIRGLLIKLMFSEDSEISAEDLATVNGIFYQIKLVRLPEKDAQNDGSSNNDQLYDFYNNLKEKAWKHFELYAKYDLY